MKSWIIGLLALMIGAAIGVFAYSRIVPFPNDVVARAAAFAPENRDWFFQNASEVFPTRTVARAEGSDPLLFDHEPLLDFTYVYDGETRTLADMYDDMETAGLIIIHDGTMIHESYGRGAGPGTQFTTFSLVKSFTSTLVGFAVGDGLIESVDDPLTTYLPDLALSLIHI